MNLVRPVVQLRPHARFHRVALLLAVATALVPGASLHAAKFSGEPEIQARPLPPEEALKSFRVEPGLTLELVVAEPLVTDPVDLTFDERGRMYVVENNGYNREGQRPRSRIKRLEDSDGDGRPDRVVIFADDLDYAQGVLRVGDGLLVTTNTGLLWLHDSDDDGRADRTEVLFTIAPSIHVDRQMSAPRRNPDNWIYLNLGLFKQELAPAGAPEKKFAITSNVRWNPATGVLEPSTGAGQFGQAIDDWGRRFFSSNRNPGMFGVLPRSFLERNPAALLTRGDEDIIPPGGDTRVYPLRTFRTTASAHAGSFTAACGTGLYRGDLLGEAFDGDLFVCEPTGSLVSRWKIEPAGASLRARRVRSDREFLASTDEWFRPVNVVNGPDGALYVVDMYRRFIDGSRFFPDDYVASNDMGAGSTHGRIYRLVPSGPAPRRPVAPIPADPAGRVALLEHRNGWHRDTAQRLLVESRAEAAAPALEAMLRSSRFAPARLHALGTLDGLGRLTAALLETALADAEPRVAEFALWLAPRFTRESESLRRRVFALADHTDPRLRFCALLVAGESTGASTDDLLVRAALRNGEDAWIRRAILSSRATLSGRVLATLLARPEFSAQASRGRIELVAGLAAVLAAQGDTAGLRPLFAALSPASGGSTAAWWQLASLRGVSEGLRRQPVARLPKNLGGLLAAPPAELAPLLDGIRALAAASTQVLSDRTRPVAERLAVIPLLEHLPKAEAAALVGPLTDRREPAEIQAAVVELLRQLDRAAITPVLYRSLDAMGGVARTGALQFLQMNPLELLRNIKAGRLNPSLVDAMGRWLILNSASEEVRTLGREIFGSTEGDRKKLVRRYAAALPALEGSAARGHEIFLQTCAVCHRFRGEGADIGPDITDVRIKSPDMLLSDILDPNNTIEPRWEAFTFEAEGGRGTTGIIQSETADAVVVRSLAGTDTLPRRSITSSRPLGLSLMPPGLEGTLTEARMADLLAFLRSDPASR